MADKLIQVNLTGKNMSPGKIRSSELADLIREVEASIATLVTTENATYEPSDIIVGLVSIEENSIDLGFAPSIEAVTIPAWYKISDGIRTSNYSEIPRNAIEHLQKIVKFSHRHNSNIEFRVLNGDSQLLATITPATNIEPVPLITGHTTIFGELRQIGGKRAQAKLALADGRAVKCVLTQELAKQLATHLYAWVGLEGIAQWNSETLDLERFKIIAIADYNETSIVDTMNDLRKSVGMYFDEIKDVDQFVRDLRGGARDY